LQDLEEAEDEGAEGAMGLDDSPRRIVYLGVLLLLLLHVFQLPIF
jgi:hypothetical protein